VTKKANKRFVVTGLAAVLLTVAAVQLYQQTGSAIAYFFAGVFLLSAFVLLVVLGIGPWAGSLGLKFPIQNTQGYRDDYATEPEKEAGSYWSEGWRRKRERAGLRNLKAFGLYIEPDEKS